MTYDEFRRARYFDSLTGLRAIAVSLVLVNHYAGKSGDFLMGWLGVQIFFVLSGFLITTLLLREHDDTGSVSLINFYVRRAFRIFPVYYLIFAVLLWQAFNMGGERWDTLVKALPYYLTFNNEQFGATSWRITWTLGIEWKFYLLWPFLAFVVARGPRSRFAIGIFTMIVLVCTWRGHFVGPAHYSVLLAGALLAMVMHDRRLYRIVQPLTTPVVSTSVCVAFAVMQFYLTDIRNWMGNPNDGPFDNLYGLMVCLLLPAILGDGLPRKVLSSKPFKFVGDRSYSLYLIQISVAEAASGFAIWRQWNFEFMLIVLAFGLIVADFLYRYVEKPMIRVGHRIEGAVARLKKAPHGITAARMTSGE
ncbi:Peptidoglycan/LPS O-acetylase OafA/YrhL [Cupriavidus sp. H19C3]|uniref:acyltransferase family protein n=1 Tax=Cupriavidus sp. H19C3 TaxID=3241603 RepID=UPI003BF7D23B